MRLLVFQHTDIEPPAAFAAHAAAAGDEVKVLRFYEGDLFPDPSRYDALMAMGGPMNVWEELSHPWLEPEKLAIRDWVDSGKPFLGVCLGHQLMVEAMGGKCTPMPRPEIGILPVTRIADDPVLDALPQQFPALHWHSVSATKLPDNCTVLAQSAACDVQAIRVRDKAWGVQFHPEMQSGTIGDWTATPEHLAEAAEWLGSVEAVDALKAQGGNELEAFFARSGDIYRAFRAQV